MQAYYVLTPVDCLIGHYFLTRHSFELILEMKKKCKKLKKMRGRPETSVVLDSRHALFFELLRSFLMFKHWIQFGDSLSGLKNDSRSS